MDGIGNRWENNRDPNNAKIFTDSRTTLCGNHKRRSVLRRMGRGGGWSPVVVVGQLLLVSGGEKMKTKHFGAELFYAP